MGGVCDQIRVLEIKGDDPGLSGWNLNVIPYKREAVGDLMKESSHMSTEAGGCAAEPKECSSRN